MSEVVWSINIMLAILLIAGLHCRFAAVAIAALALAAVAAAASVDAPATT